MVVVDNRQRALYSASLPSPGSSSVLRAPRLSAGSVSCWTGGNALESGSRGMSEHLLVHFLPLVCFRSDSLFFFMHPAMLRCYRTLVKDVLVTCIGFEDLRSILRTIHVVIVFSFSSAILVESRCCAEFLQYIRSCRARMSARSSSASSLTSSYFTMSAK